jgi:hypothetical protein
MDGLVPRRRQPSEGGDLEQREHERKADEDPCDRARPGGSRVPLHVW